MILIQPHHVLLVSTIAPSRNPRSIGDMKSLPLTNNRIFSSGLTFHDVTLWTDHNVCLTKRYMHECWHLNICTYFTNCFALLLMLLYPGTLLSYVSVSLQPRKIPVCLQKCTKWGKFVQRSLLVVYKELWLAQACRHLRSKRCFYSCE